MNNPCYILSIETSCDETAAAVSKGEKVLSSALATQIDIHKKYGGVVPEIASREHLVVIEEVVEKAITDSGITKNDLSAVAVTYGPGLVGALLVGLSFAKAFAYSLGIPIIGVNHMAGHIGACYLAGAKDQFIALVVSGGHTEIVKVSGLLDYKVLGTTKDDAAGEAYDKVARTLSLPYPGGPEVEKLSLGGNKENVPLPFPMLNEDNYDFSFSGLKSAVINFINQKNMKKEDYNKNDLAESFCVNVATVLSQKAIRAAKNENIMKIAVCGGVGANNHLREMLKKRCKEENIELVLPEKKLCTDNAAMIAVVANQMYERKLFSDIYLNADPALDF